MGQAKIRKTEIDKLKASNPKSKEDFGPTFLHYNTGDISARPKFDPDSETIGLYQHKNGVRRIGMMGVNMIITPEGMIDMDIPAIVNMSYYEPNKSKTSAKWNTAFGLSYITKVNMGNERCREARICIYSEKVETHGETQALHMLDVNVTNVRDINGNMDKELFTKFVRQAVHSVPGHIGKHFARCFAVLDDSTNGEHGLHQF